MNIVSEQKKKPETTSKISMLMEGQMKLNHQSTLRKQSLTKKEL